MHYLGLCCIVKDETPFLEEWIAFHALMGVEAFVMYDNGSAIPVHETLGPLSRRYAITVVEAPGPARQIPCYDHCLKTFGKHFAWMGFIDMDEFVLPLRHPDLRLLLSQYEHRAGLGFHWMPFGSNGHKTRPSGLQIENYTLALPSLEPAIWHVKLFVRPSKIRYFINPHTVSCLEGEVVNTDNLPVRGPMSHPIARDLCQINHYYFRSNQDFYKKMQRGMADSRREHRIPTRLDLPRGDVEDLAAARHGPRVRQLLEQPETGQSMLFRPQIPDTPEALADIFASLVRQRPAEALILLAKGRQRFPGHPLLALLTEKSAKLAACIAADSEPTFGHAPSIQ